MVRRMDALDCKSPARCQACEHFDRGACALEADLLAALEALAPRPRAPVRVRAPALAAADARAVVAA